MRDYIESYTAILPVAQRNRIMSELNKNPDMAFKGSNEQYEELINIIADERIIASTYSPMKESLDSGIYNDFISNALLDLHILYNENDLLEKAIKDYVNQNQSMVGEVRSYIDELRHKISALRYNDKTTSAAATYIESFKNMDSIVKRTSDNESDFRDRDGRILQECTINNNIGYAVLNEESNIDIILEDRPSIEIVNITGQSELSNIFLKEYAIDRDINTFWGNVIHVDGPIDIPIILRADNGKALTVRGGAIAVFDIIFKAKQRINNISFKMFEEFPTNVETILYKTTGAPEEDFKQLIGDSKKAENQIVSFSFQPTNVKTLRIVLKQINHKKHEFTVFKSDQTNSDMIKHLINASVTKSMSGNFSNLTPEEMDKYTGVEAFKRSYAEFLTKLENFRTQLRNSGFNWTEAKIKEYIKTGRY